MSGGRGRGSRFRPASTFLALAGFAFALLAVVLRGTAIEIGAEVDALLRRNRALGRSVGTEGALVEELRSPAAVAERIAALRRRGKEEP